MVQIVVKLVFVGGDAGPKDIDVKAMLRRRPHDAHDSALIRLSIGFSERSSLLRLADKLRRGVGELMKGRGLKGGLHPGLHRRLGMLDRQVQSIPGGGESVRDDGVVRPDLVVIKVVLVIQ